MLHSYLINGLEVVSIVFQLVLAVRFSLDGSLLRYPLLLIYCLAASITGMAEYFVQNYRSHELFIKLYYSDEVVVDALLFLMVITLTYRAMEGHAMRRKAGRALGGVTLVVLVLPFLIFYKYFRDFASFMNGAGEVLNFGATIMSLLLWTALLGAKKRDGQLIMVCTGLGLQVTSQTIGFGIRQMLASRQEWRWIPDVFMGAAYLLSIYIWWCAFRPPRKAAAREPLPHPAAHGVR